MPTDKRNNKMHAYIALDKIDWGVLDIDNPQNDETHDNVHHPSHYEILPGIEAIDIIGSVLNANTMDSFTPYAAYCLGNVIKYILRAGQKNGVEDYEKAKVYLDWLIEEVGGDI